MQKHHPFGIKVPRSPEWPPYRYVPNPPGPVIIVPGQSLIEKFINMIKSVIDFTPGDLDSLAAGVANRIREVVIITDEDIRAAYQSNLKYSHEILQYTQDVGRAAEADLVGHGRDIRALVQKLDQDVKALQHVITRDRKTAKLEAQKAQAYAIKKAVADSTAWFTKHYEKKIAAVYDWLKNRDTWFEDKVSKWWKAIYRKQIVQIKQAANGWQLPFAGLANTINVEIKPTVKLVAGASDWLKFFKHWEKRALEAFGVLKAAEVLQWLVREKAVPPAG